MHIGQPSRTALSAATHRATHQVLEGGRLFKDPMAVRVLGIEADVLRREAEAAPDRRRMRWFIAARTRFAEDALADAFNHGVLQLVILGAGLDTYAYRGPLREQLRIFEVDHPATQSWKQRQLEAAHIRAPATLTYAPIDFERDTLANGLAAAGFDATEPTFFMWLGVVPYLSADAIFD
ncbi:MAG TPA: class I SAM-dependent methyltransferase, partial [Burkholderiales bacterium]|nr:class I SAM-dependent methyltransferase [Burkholderiales bacterium]